MTEVLLMIYFIGAIIIAVTMTPTFVGCIAGIFRRRASVRNRVASFLWIFILVLIAVLWPLAVLVLLWEWRSMK